MRSPELACWFATWCAAAGLEEAAWLWIEAAVTARLTELHEQIGLPP